LTGDSGIMGSAHQGVIWISAATAPGSAQRSAADVLAARRKCFSAVTLTSKFSRYLENFEVSRHGSDAYWQYSLVNYNLVYHDCHN
jgi:hypothetical protein